MKPSMFTLLLCLTLLAPGAAMADKWDSQWKKVDEAVNQGLPKTAIEQLQPILDAATKEKNYPVAIKAIGRKIALDGVIQGNKPEEKITRMDAEIAKAPADMRPMLEPDAQETEVVQARHEWHEIDVCQCKVVAKKPGSTGGEVGLHCLECFFERRDALQHVGRVHTLLEA